MSPIDKIPTVGLGDVSDDDDDEPASVVVAMVRIQRGVTVRHSEWSESVTTTIQCQRGPKLDGILSKKIRTLDLELIFLKTKQAG